MVQVEHSHRPGFTVSWQARLMAFSLYLLAAPVAHAAETIVCADADDEIRFSYGIDPELEQPVLWVEMQLTGDYGLSTDPAHDKFDGEYVAKGFVGDDVEGGDVAWRDEEGREHHAMSFRLGRVYEARDGRIAGAVSVDGGGLWTVTCTEAEPDDAQAPAEPSGRADYLCRSLQTNRQIGRLRHDGNNLMWFDAGASSGTGSGLTTRIEADKLYVTGGRLFERYGLIWTTLAPDSRNDAPAYAFYHATGPVLVCTASSPDAAD